MIVEEFIQGWRGSNTQGNRHCGGKLVGGTLPASGDSMSRIPVIEKRNAQLKRKVCASAEGILITAEPITITVCGIAYRTERTTLTAKRVAAAQISPAFPPPSAPAVAKPADPLRHSLCREAGCWVLLFKDGRAYLKYEIGLEYVAYLLSQPGEPVPSATLFSKFSAGHRKNLAAAELPDPETGLPVPLTDGVGIAQLPLDKDEAKARSRYHAQLREYQEAMDDETIPESERAEAQHSYDELFAFLKEHYRPARSPGRAVTKLVHRSIQRLCDHLREPMPGAKAPSPVALAFAEYVEEHILVPSRRYTLARPGARVRIARGELAGRLIFECPPDDRWSVHL